MQANRRGAQLKKLRIELLEVAVAAQYRVILRAQGVVELNVDLVIPDAVGHARVLVDADPPAGATGRVHWRRRVAEGHAVSLGELLKVFSLLDPLSGKSL